MCFQYRALFLSSNSGGVKQGRLEFVLQCIPVGSFCVWPSKSQRRKTNAKEQVPVEKSSDFLKNSSLRTQGITMVLEMALSVIPTINADKPVVRTAVLLYIYVRVPGCRRTLNCFIIAW